ncbi:hypothetical protein LXM94_09110 [Rhizobium sp. TRM95111]|uniref:hypothetical protein n=1 Tax=Rhizobium alarense TaxID=2846851 RepID=UPI001F2FA49C|nr:hypothetical protein [Rhizobium alarense]MCF3640126.1 hypothetical protein [Rhizobium alarense]
MDASAVQVISQGPSFKHVGRGSRRCVVVFSSFAARDYGPDAYSFFPHLKPHFNEADFLFIKDARNQWYNRGLCEIADTADELTKWLASKISAYDETSFFGSSMGGYAALLFGGRVQTQHIVAIAPQTFLRKGYPRYGSSHSGNYIEIECADLATVGRVDIVVGENNLFDLHQSNRLLGTSNIRRSVVPIAYHNVLEHWHSLGLTQSLMAAVAGFRWPEFLSTVDLRARGLELGDETEILALIDSYVYLRYSGDKLGSLNALKRLRKIAPEWQGPMVAVGLLKLELGALFDGVRILKKVMEQGTKIHGFFRPLAVALAQLKRPQEAVDVAIAGTRLNPKNRLAFSEIEPIFRAYGLQDFAQQCSKLAQKA